MIFIFLISIVLILVHASSETDSCPLFNILVGFFFFFLIVMKWWGDLWRHKLYCQVYTFAFSVSYLSYSQLLKVLVRARVWTQMWPEQTLFHLFHDFSVLFFLFPLTIQKRTVSNLSGMLIFPYELMLMMTMMREFQNAFATFCVGLFRFVQRWWLEHVPVFERGS